MEFASLWRDLVGLAVIAEELGIRIQREKFQMTVDATEMAVAH
jgi:hypothetical protein